MCFIVPHLPTCAYFFQLVSTCIYLYLQQMLCLSLLIYKYDSLCHVMVFLCQYMSENICLCLCVSPMCPTSTVQFNACTSRFLMYTFALSVHKIHKCTLPSIFFKKSKGIIPKFKNNTYPLSKLLCFKSISKVQGI